MRRSVVVARRSHMERHMLISSTAVAVLVSRTRYLCVDPGGCPGEGCAQPDDLDEYLAAGESVVSVSIHRLPLDRDVECSGCGGMIHLEGCSLGH